MLTRWAEQVCQSQVYPSPPPTAQLESPLQLLSHPLELIERERVALAGDDPPSVGAHDHEAALMGKRVGGCRVTRRDPQRSSARPVRSVGGPALAVPLVLGRRHGLSLHPARRNAQSIWKGRLPDAEPVAGRVRPCHERLGALETLLATSGRKQAGDRSGSRLRRRGADVAPSFLDRLIVHGHAIFTPETMDELDLADLDEVEAGASFRDA